MKKIPSSAREFARLFKTNNDCRRFLERVRWPGGFVCPRCEHTEGLRLLKRNAIQCRKCRKQTSVTAGTIFHGVKLLPKWFLLIFRICEGKSSANLAIEAGLSYSGAWEIIQKLRTVIESQFPADTKEAPMQMFERILFRRSRETSAFVDVSEQNESDSIEAGTAVSESLASAIPTAISFISDAFHGISRKYLSKYSAAFWCHQDNSRWHFDSLLAACLTSGPITKEMLANYSSPPMIKLRYRNLN
jgi:transcription elongation factor Elf1